MLKKIFFNEIEILFSDEVYEPHEDSFLLANAIPENLVKNKKCLDLGCGSGIQAVNLALKKAVFVLAVDINEKALELTQLNARNNFLNQIKTLKSDLFESINEKFEVIVFNPPYLPSSELKFKELDGGFKGRFLIDRFLERFSNYLESKGLVFLIQSSLNDFKLTENFLLENGFEFKAIANQKMFFEELKVYQISRT